MSSRTYVSLSNTSHYTRALHTRYTHPNQDRTVRLWNPHKGIPIKVYAGHGYEVRWARGARREC